MSSNEAPPAAGGAQVASVVLNYGRADLARSAVESLLATKLERHRVLLADNASPDAARAASHARELGISALLLDRNYGFAEGMNRALAEADRLWRPEYFFLLNGDARVEADALGELVTAARGRGAQLAGPKVLFEGLGPARLWAAGGSYRRFRARNRGEGEQDLGQFDAAEAVSFLSGCALLIRRDAWLELGGFDRRFFMYQEDADLCLRAGRRGFALLYVPAARVHHHGSASAGGQYSAFQSFYRWRNRLLLIAKNTRGLERAFFFAAFFPALAARDLFRYARLGRWREARAMLAGLLDFCAGSRASRRPEDLAPAAGGGRAALPADRAGR